MRNPGIHFVILAVLAAAPAFAADRFETRLAPSPMTDGTRVDIAGEGRAAATLDGNTLTVSGDFHGLKSNATTAQLYFGIAIGAMGPKAFDLTVTPGMTGNISGSFKPERGRRRLACAAANSMSRSTARRRRTAI